MCVCVTESRPQYLLWPYYETERQGPRNAQTFMIKQNIRRTAGQVARKKIQKCLKNFFFYKHKLNRPFERLSFRREKAILNQRYQIFGTIQNLRSPEFISRNLVNCNKDHGRRHNMSYIYIYIYIYRVFHDLRTLLQ